MGHEGKQIFNYLDNTSTKLRTSPLDGSNEYQVWKLDEDGHLINRGSGKYLKNLEMVEVSNYDYVIKSRYLSKEGY